VCVVVGVAVCVALCGIFLEGVLFGLAVSLDKASRDTLLGSE